MRNPNCFSYPLAWLLAVGNLSPCFFAQAESCNLCPFRGDVPSFPDRLIILGEEEGYEDLLVETCGQLEIALSAVSKTSKECQEAQAFGTYCGCPIPRDVCRLCPEGQRVAEEVANLQLEGYSMVDYFPVLIAKDNLLLTCELLESLLHTWSIDTGTSKKEQNCDTVVEDVASLCTCASVSAQEEDATDNNNATFIPIPIFPSDINDTDKEQDSDDALSGNHKSLLFLRDSKTNTKSNNNKQPLKVFIMVGQSNMQGHGYMATQDDSGNFKPGTLEWMIESYPQLYGKLKQANGNYSERSDVYITYNRQNYLDLHIQTNQHGRLTAGYGGDPGQQGHQMGPELGFGWTLAESMNQQKQASTANGNSNAHAQILLLKVAWGGRSLAKEFRPPSSGGIVGPYYESVLAHTFQVLLQLEQLFPDYFFDYPHDQPKYELSGFVWHQGWNDGCDVNMTKEYEYNLANLIRDLRKDLQAPYLPVAIGVSGMEGWKYSERRNGIIDAQFAVANATKYPEFQGTVVAVETRDFQRNQTDSPGTQDYHWNNNCESYWLVGQAMAKGMLQLLGYKNHNDEETGEHITLFANQKDAINAASVATS